MKSLDALERLYCAGRLDLDYVINGKQKEDYNIIESELKALEIIKNKCVDLEYLKCCENYEQYKTLCSYWNEITEKEYDLLKEVLL